ncbi:hypothetical protein, partial [Bradyrhizobium liaoningense]|uniref:hypothetical protein n=1 Tax=Bradyrhizobium liaoningense TaxID=43992 RepID=UPI001BA92F4F
SLLIRSKNPRRCQAENPLKLLSEFAGPALSCEIHGKAKLVTFVKPKPNRTAPGGPVTHLRSRKQKGPNQQARSESEKPQSAG